MSAQAILECASAKHRLNWNDLSLLLLACEYIDNQKDDQAFEDFVEQRASAEAAEAAKEDAKIDFSTFDKWKAEVERLFKEKTECTWADLCGEEEPLTSAFEDKESPRQFVNWYCEKYGLGD